jgi:hypothetical protein
VHFPALLSDIERARAQRAAAALLVGQRLEGILYGPPERLVLSAIGIEGGLFAELDPGAWMADEPTLAGWSLANAGAIVSEVAVFATGVLTLRLGAAAIHCDPATPWRLRVACRSPAQESVLAVSREGLDLRIPRGALPARAWDPTRTR